MINHYIHLYTRISSKQPEFKGKYLRVFLWLGWLPWMIGEFLSPNSGHGRKFYLLIRGSIGCSWSLRRNPAVACGLCYWSRMLSTCNIVMTWFLHISIGMFGRNIHTNKNKQAKSQPVCTPCHCLLPKLLQKKWRTFNLHSASRYSPRPWTTRSASWNT